MQRTVLHFAAYRRPLSEDEVKVDPYLSYFPPNVQSEIFKSFYNGYQGVMYMVWTMLAGYGKSKIPYPSQVMSNLPSTYGWSGWESGEQFFLRKGGRVEHVLDCLLDIAEKNPPMQSSLVSAGSRNDSLNLDRAQPKPLVPTCANDGNFDLCRRKLGLWGNLD